MLGRFIEEVNQHIRDNQRKLNIIFLDIDGVIFEPHNKIHEKRTDDEINNIKSHPRIKEAISNTMLDNLRNTDLSAALCFSEDATKNVRKLCDENDAKIVVSSSWRDSNNLEKLKALFSLSNLNNYIFDCTPKLSSRGEEIEAWLFQNPQVKSFVILDDQESDIKFYFGERLVLCKTIFSNDLLYAEASAMLKKPVNYETSEIKLCFDAIERNSSHVTEANFNLENMTKLKLCLKIDYATLAEKLFSALEKNTQITHLSFHHFDYLEDSIVFLSRVSSLLKNTQMKLSYLNLAHNAFYKINDLLSVIDGKEIHIPHISFNANPLSEQLLLANWIKDYPLPLILDLDLNGASGKYKLEECVIDALENNPNITVNANKDLLPFPVTDERIDKLIQSEQLFINDRSERPHKKMRS